MKAAVLEKAGHLVIKEVPEPTPGEYEALCEILYGAICTGTDSHILNGTFSSMGVLPTIIGHESIGRVLECGSKVRSFKKGDLITRVGTPAVPGYSVTWGGFAEWGIARDHGAMKADGRPEAEWRRSRIHQVLPPESDPAAATMIITWRETFSYLTRIGLASSQHILVLGSGGNAFAFVAEARALGCARIAMLGSDSRRELATRAGVTDFVDYRGDSPMNGLGSLGLFDIIIDAVGKNGMADKALSCLKPGGTIGIYGLDEPGQCLLNPYHARGSFRFYKDGYDESEAHSRVVDLMREGKLDASLWMDLQNPYSLDRINDAFADLRARKALKAVVKIKS